MHANIPLAVISDLLQHHPLIKFVTPQKRVTRHLQYVNSSSDSDIANEQPSHYKSRQMLWNHDNSFSFNSYSITDTRRRLLRAIPVQITNVLQADVLWKMGITGAGVKVAVFDTGIAKSHKHFKKIKERTNWTNERYLF